MVGLRSGGQDVGGGYTWQGQSQNHRYLIPPDYGKEHERGRQKEVHCEEMVGGSKR